MAAIYTNHHHTMFGGSLMANIDEIAAITAMKHANAQVVTASTASMNHQTLCGDDWCLEEILV
jgi:acyl-CoA hydrolase